MIPEVVTLKFNPETAGDEIRKVFSDDLARLLWLTVKSTHVVSQNFDADCLRYAETLREFRQKELLTAKQLLRILEGLPGHSMLGEDELVFAAELLLFVNGTKDIGFEIISK